MPIDNSTSLSLSSSFIAILPSLFIGIIGVIIGFFGNHILQKKSDKREKAKDIRSFFSNEQKGIVTNELKKIKNGDFLRVEYALVNDNLTLEFVLNHNQILECLVDSQYFKKDTSNNLILKYTSNRNFTKYANEIIKHVTEYNQNANKLNLFFNNVKNESIVLSNFRDSIRKLDRRSDSLKDKELFLIFMCCLFGSPNSFKVGNKLTFDLLHQKSDELTQSIILDDKNVKLFKDIQKVREECLSNLQNLNKTLSDLCETFQNKYDI
jgi:hypothetical protein